MVLFPLMKSDTNEEKKKTTNIAVVVLSKDAKLESWQELNTTAHLAASLAARKGKMLFDVPMSKSADGVDIPMNIGDAIILKTADTLDMLHETQKEAQTQNIENFLFTRAMLESSNDSIVDAKHREQNYNDIEKLGMIFYGERKILEKLTEKCERYS